MDTETRVCSKCPEKGEQSISNFHRRGNNFQKICKACRCAESRDGYRDHGKSRIDRPLQSIDRSNFPALAERITKLSPWLKDAAEYFFFTSGKFVSNDIYSEMVEAILTKCKPDDTDAYLKQCARWAAKALIFKNLTYNSYIEELEADGDEAEVDGFKVVNTRTVEDEIIHHETLEQFRKVIATLPEKHQKIIAMVSIGKNQREIAAELKVSEQTVSQRLKDLRAQLSANLVTSAAF